MRRKGFTLVELLVVIAIIALLMGILMPALAQVRRLAQRIICGTHLSAIGKAILVYIQDNDEDFPRSGGKLSELSNSGRIADWDAVGTAGTPAQYVAFGRPPQKPATITSCFFLLIKYSDGIPKIFNCAGDVGARVFELSDSTNTTLVELQSAWDFGDGQEPGLLYPGQYESYSYHMPFNWDSDSGDRCFALSGADSAASPVCADRNPYLDINAKDYIDGKDPEDEPVIWDVSGTGVIDADHVRNSAAHQRDGQNVLYVDGHVDFETSPACGVQGDLIWANWTTGDSSVMLPKDRQFRDKDLSNIIRPNRTYTDLGPQHMEDAFLISEANCHRQQWW